MEFLAALLLLKNTRNEQDGLLPILFFKTAKVLGISFNEILTLPYSIRLLL
jgi:hypothetical protein